MKTSLRSIRGAAGLALHWAAGWAAVGMVIEVIAQILPGLPIVSAVDRWPAELATPGFVGGAVFAAVLRIAEGRRGLDATPLLRAGAWGAVSGLLLGVFAVAADSGLATGVFPGLWPNGAVLIACMTVLGAGSAPASWVLCRLTRFGNSLSTGQRGAALAEVLAAALLPVTAPVQPPLPPQAAAARPMDPHVRARRADPRRPAGISVMIVRGGDTRV
ncbi:MAG TPA: hypothetical protein VF006_13490 [Longimicrobium sp.]